jgi:hypothetical protein
VVCVPTYDQDVALIVDFVRRLRRVALHPLALEERDDEELPLPGDQLRYLMSVTVNFFIRGDSTATMRVPFPDEVSFESLAVRVRSFTLPKDRLFWKKGLAALDRLTGLDHYLVRSSSEELREEWRAALARDAETRAYRVDTDDGSLTDLDLAYAWLYQDVAHGDASKTLHFDIIERYLAAIGIFSHIAVVAIETLHYVNLLVQDGVIDLPVGTFSDPVIVTTNEYDRDAKVYMADPDTDFDFAGIGPDDELPPHFRPAYEVLSEEDNLRSQKT